MTRSYDIIKPFEPLNMVAGHWLVRPTDKGDGRGYTGIALWVRSVTGEVTEFTGEDLDDLVIDATVWCQQFAKLPQPTNNTQAKRVIPRS